MTSKLDIKAEDFKFFHDISTFIHSKLDLNEMLHRIFERIKTDFNVEGASVALHDPKRGEFFFIHTLEMNAGKGFGGLRRMRFPDHLGVAGWVLRQNRPAIISDPGKEKRFYNGIDIKQNFVTKNMICLPLLTRRGIIGVFYVLNKREGVFTEKEAWLLESLATTIAVAIENAKLYGELKNHISSLKAENRRLKMEQKERYSFEGVISSSRAMQRALHLVNKVLDAKTPVLLLGETGVGKELAARLIHHNGPRRDKPFVVENCASLSENLLESELFGHTKGAFTGATSDKKGLFELAQGGVVFLDEIGDMPPGMQVKLLRVLQDGKVRPVGGDRLRKVDFRLISATNRNLEEAVLTGEFREDLFYRVNVFPIEIPPLRERREDIPLMIDHFIRKYSKTTKRPLMRVTPKSLDLLCQYNWPGNVRELANEIERAAMLASPGRRIDEKHLSNKIVDGGSPTPGPKASGETLRQYIERIEKRWIEDTLEETRGNRTRAAKTLGLTRQGLLKKMKRYKIDL